MADLGDIKNILASTVQNLDWLEVDEKAYRDHDILPQQNLDISPDLINMWRAHDQAPHHRIDVYENNGYYLEEICLTIGWRYNRSFAKRIADGLIGYNHEHESIQKIQEEWHLRPREDLRLPENQHPFRTFHPR